MSKVLAGIAALTIVGAAALPLPASAAEHGASRAQSTELSSQRHWRGHRYYARRYWGPRRYWGGPRYGYYGSPYGYGYPYGYYRPGLAFGVGPFGFRFF